MPLRIPHVIGSSAVISGGDQPELWALYSLDDASEPTPTWRDASADVRSFSVSRGRDSELDEIDAGTASLVLDSRDRAYDPDYTAGIRPLNRWWLRAQSSGVTEDIYKGYAESYTQSWPDPVADQTAAVSLVDEQKILNLIRLPSVVPPSDSYADVIAADLPDGYWPIHDATGSYQFAAAIGDLFYPDSTTNTAYFTDGPLVVDYSPTGNYSGRVVGGAGAFYVRNSASAAENPLGDTSGLATFTVELWVNVSAAPGTNQTIWASPVDGAATTKWQIQLETSRAITGWAKNSAGTVHTVTTAPLDASTWYHIVWTLAAGTLRLYINGLQAGSTGWAGAFSTTLNASTGTTMALYSNAGITVKLAQLAFYRTSLSATRVAAHYDAGVTLVYPQDRVGTRMERILAATRPELPRSIRTATRNVNATMMRGQVVLEELTRTLSAENVDAMFFISRSGAFVFLDKLHRLVAPWSTAQATFSDLAGPVFSYLDLELDYSESFLFNEWSVSHEGRAGEPAGDVQTVYDSASIAAYFKRSASLGALPIGDDVTALNIANELLVKYVAPFTRITAITPNMSDPDVAAGVFARELGDRVRILRSPLGGGADIDQSPWIQKIEYSGAPGEPWRCRLAVSPR